MPLTNLPARDHAAAKKLVLSSAGRCEQAAPGLFMQLTLLTTCLPRR